MTVLATRECSCEWRIYGGQKRPKTCVHGNRLLTEAERNPKPRKPMHRVSETKASTARKQGSTLKRTQHRESKLEREARGRFNDTVKSWPCWFSWHRPCERCEGAGEILAPLSFAGRNYGDGPAECPSCGGDGKHHCTKPKDAHHLVPKDFIRQRFQAVLAEDRFVAILHNPKLGAPLCRKAHDAIEAGNDRIYWEDLSEECLEYAGSLPEFVLMRLELECPKRNQEAALAAPDLPLSNHNQRSIDAASR